MLRSSIGLGEALSRLPLYASAFFQCLLKCCLEKDGGEETAAFIPSYFELEYDSFLHGILVRLKVEATLFSKTDFSSQDAISCSGSRSDTHYVMNLSC